MKRAILFIIFVASLFGLFVWLFLHRDALSLINDSRNAAKTIVPSVSGTASGDATDVSDSATYDESKTQPLIVLETDETFIQALSADFNKDGVADQICAVKKNTEPNIYLVPGIQNPLSTDYSRLQPIRTGVTQTRTLLVYAIDIVGDHSNAVVCSGMTADNQQILAVYLPNTDSQGKISFTPVADLRSDGSITIQEVPRSDAYALGQTGGASYPISTYSSDPDAPQTLNQIERVYRWDATYKRYTQVSESRIEGKKIETKLIRQLQSGNSDSFESFLQGLWYMTDSARGKSKYLYFNPDEDEIVFHDGATEEVYTRESTSNRRYGEYLVTHNVAIPSIRRLIDIDLTGIDEIRLKVFEDVKLKIGVASDWDGTYRKLSMNSTPPADAESTSLDDVRQAIEANSSAWISQDGQIFTAKNGGFTLTQGESQLSGKYALISVSGKPVIQMRVDGTAKKTLFYLIDASISAKSPVSTQKITLTEVSVTIDGTNFMGSPPVVFNRQR